jgi:Zn-dependent peptidase ImmA (M78 family)
MAVIDFKRDKRIRPVEREALREFASDLGQEIVELADRLGLKVFESEMDDASDACLQYAPSCGSKSGFRVVINSNQPPERQRFSVAHEIAHFVLHRDDPKFLARVKENAEVFDFRFANRSDDSFLYERWEFRFEFEANRFAAVLLMPEHLVVRHPAFLTDQPGLLARELGLSQKTVEIRFEEIRNSIHQRAEVKERSLAA